MKILYQNTEFVTQLRRKTIRAMKLIAILTLAVIFQLRAEVHSQPFNFNESNTTVKQMFKQIEKNSKYSIFYRLDQVKLDQKINVIINDGTIENVMSQVLSNQPLTFEVVDQVIVIKYSDSKEIEFRAVIRGQVKDSKGVTLPGVSVRVKGTNFGATTDINGNFSLDAPENGILVFSYIGFVSQEVAVNNRTNINITLMEDSQMLGEVVVTALGIEREAKSLTYSVQTLQTEKINEAKTTNMVTALQGKVAGMRIMMSPNGPGSSASVVLRGQRSLSGNNQPLYIIDGVPLDNSSRTNAIAGTTGVYGGRDGGDGIGMLNSDDVESITVLKGASAAALYGSQGQNGAIIITTKRGTAGKVSVNYTGNASYDTPNILPEIQYEYGQGAGGVYNSNSENSWGPKATGQMVTLWNGSTVPFVGQEGRLNDFLRTAKTLNNSISITGGGSLMQTYFSYGNTSAEGILPNQDLNRHNFDLKLDNKISSKLSFATKLTYIREDMDNKASTDSHIDVYSRILKAPVTIPLNEMQKYEYFDDLGNRKQSFWRPGSVFNSNPYWAMNRHLFFEQKDRILGLVSAKYKFNDWLDLQVRGSMDKTINRTDDRMYEDSYHWAGIGAIYGLRNLRSTGINVDALLSFRRKISKKFEINGNLGASIQESKYDSQETNARGLIKKDFFFMQNAVNVNATNEFGRSPQVQSVYGISTLTYNNYLYLDVTVRNDWSSALTAGNQSYFYPSLAYLRL